MSADGISGSKTGSLQNDLPTDKTDGTISATDDTMNSSSLRAPRPPIGIPSGALGTKSDVEALMLSEEAVTALRVSGAYPFVYTAPPPPLEDASSTVKTTSEARSIGRTYMCPETAAEIITRLKFSPRCHSAVTTSVSRFPRFSISIWSDIGSRKSQEDRVVFCPELVPGRDDCSFFGLFDGTVGDFASDNIKNLCIPHLLGSKPWPRLLRALTLSEECRRRVTTNAVATNNAAVANSPHHELMQGFPDDEELLAYRQRLAEVSSESELARRMDEFLPLVISSAVDWMYLNSDAELLEMCRQQDKHYASSTAVTVLLIGPYCCVGHLGDSRAALGYEERGRLYGEFLTLDHRPNHQVECFRIRQQGGSVEYLQNHNNKPFIRGGDFTSRKAQGEQPMQLQYSRAFGGKDLKNYGLSNEPDLRLFRITQEHHVLVLASDGIWDVQSAASSIEICLRAEQKNSPENHPAMALVSSTLAEQRVKNQNADNVTAIVVFLARKALKKRDAAQLTAAPAAGSDEGEIGAGSCTDSFESLNSPNGIKARTNCSNGDNPPQGEGLHKLSVNAPYNHDILEEKRSK